jgi:hypothetical protein
VQLVNLPGQAGGRWRRVAAGGAQRTTRSVHGARRVFANRKRMPALAAASIPEYIAAAGAAPGGWLHLSGASEAMLAGAVVSASSPAWSSRLVVCRPRGRGSTGPGRAECGRRRRPAARA